MLNSEGTPHIKFTETEIIKMKQEQHVQLSIVETDIRLLLQRKTAVFYMVRQE